MQITKPQSYICPIVQADFTYIQTKVNLLWEVHCIKYRMGKPKLIAYASKRLPEAARNYSITEFELCG